MSQQLVIAFAQSPVEPSRLELAPRIVAIETAGVDEDWPPSAEEIIARWLAQGVIEEVSQVEVWDVQAGWFWTRGKLTPRAAGLVGPTS